MRVGTNVSAHLTYCTNVHAGETWPEIFKNIRSFVPDVKARVSPDMPFGVGLRLSAGAARELAEHDRLEEFRAFLETSGLYVFTINGFPYGAFHGSRVKENVYLPDWRDERRVAYTNQLSDILAALLPSTFTGFGSVSTVPGAFESEVTGPGVVERIAETIVRHAAHLVDLRRRTGRTIVLAIEPEPSCFLETIEGTIDFFERHLFSEDAARRLGESTGLDHDDARTALRTHLGVCLDLCHAAVEFEDAERCVARLRTAGIAIAKMQISAGLRAAHVTPAVVSALRAFDDGVYLHQVVEQAGGVLRRYVDLDDAFAVADRDEHREWRVHFHVPIFRADIGTFETTQPFLREMLALQRERQVSPHLEIETYTWHVLPEEHRGEGIVESISRELEWALWQLAG